MEMNDKKNVQHFFKKPFWVNGVIIEFPIIQFFLYTTCTLIKIFKMWITPNNSRFIFTENCNTRSFFYLKKGQYKAIKIWSVCRWNEMKRKKWTSG